MRKSKCMNFPRCHLSERKFFSMDKKISIFRITNCTVADPDTILQYYDSNRNISDIIKYVMNFRKNLIPLISTTLASRIFCVTFCLFHQMYISPYHGIRANFAFNLALKHSAFQLQNHNILDFIH